MPTGSAVRAVVVVAVCTLLMLARPAGAREDDAAARRLLESPEFSRASAFIRTDHDRFVRELVALTEIPAPPFKEERRARAFMDALEGLGLRDVHMDPEGNVMGLRPGTGGGLLAVVAHLDTVFPEGTGVTVHRKGTRLYAPGVGDNTRGLALMLAVIRALDAGGFTTSRDILFVGNVGEEGEGDLRGVKYLLTEGPYTDRITHFLAIDGGDQGSITRGAVGSTRYRVVFTGPGGHSYGAFGLVNPAYAMAAAIARLSDLRVPSAPRTTYNIGAVRGGTSVNSIPAEVSMDVDLRSESCAELQKLDAALHAILKTSVEEENRVRSTREGRIAVDPRVIGDRPCGETPVDAPIVRTVTAVVRAFGLMPTYAFSSTDSNVPMSLGIPALTIGRGGPGGRSHAPDEWTDVAPAGVARSVEIALAAIVAVAGMR
jgi:tripeptide aminopeptidase